MVVWPTSEVARHHAGCIGCREPAETASPQTMSSICLHDSCVRSMITAWRYLSASCMSVLKPRHLYMQVFLQEFCWSEEAKSGAIAQRAEHAQHAHERALLTREPMFCFQTAQAMLRWSCLTYLGERQMLCQALCLSTCTDPSACAASLSAALHAGVC